MRFDDIEAYLALLTDALRKRGVSNLRMVEEARGHLADAVEQGIQRGLDPHTAQREAIAQFGPASSVAATYVLETYRLFDRLVLLAAIIVGLTIAYIDSSSNWDDTGVTALFLVLAAAIGGFVAPRQPWRWALAIGSWIPLLAIARSASLQTLAMLIVLALPLVGAYAGMALRRERLKLVFSLGEDAPDLHREFHDKSDRFHFVVMSKRGWVNPELAAIVADPDTQLIPFLKRMAPAPLGSLGKAQSVTSLDDNGQVRKFQVVFGDEKKVICRIEIGRGGTSVSTHWSRTNEGR